MQYLRSVLIGIAAVVPVLMFGNVEIGTAAPNFQVTDIYGAPCALRDYRGKIVVLEWTNATCPYVQKQYSENNDTNVGALSSMQKRYTASPAGVVWLLVCSSAKDSSSYLDVQAWKRQLVEWKAHPTTLILDETKELATLFHVRRTPEVFVIGRDGTLVYMGAVDSLTGTDSREVSQPMNLHWLRNAIDHALEGRRVEPSETIPYGCAID